MERTVNAPRLRCRPCSSRRRRPIRRLLAASRRAAGYRDARRGGLVRHRRAFRAPAQARFRWSALARRSRGPGRRSFARHHLAGGRRLHPEPTARAPHLAYRGNHHLCVPHDRRAARSHNRHPGYLCRRPLFSRWRGQGNGLWLRADRLRHDGLLHRRGRRLAARHLPRTDPLDP